jgi:glycosyltransferase involved in cell wall biosynthesis
MRIGIIIGRIGDVDGVALETEKWIHVLQRMGHEIFILSGHFKRDIIAPERQKALRCMSFFSPECEWEQNRAFFFPPDEPERLLLHLDDTANYIATEIFRWVLENRIQVMLSENASSLPAHLSMGIGIKTAVEHMGIPVVTHDHDFHWERGDRYDSPFSEIDRLVAATFPLRLPGVRHAVINSALQADLKKRFDLESMVVPNVMDFSQPFGKKDAYNADLPSSIGLEESDTPLFQITRIVRRKGIEVAVELMERLDDPKIKLVITGSAADDHRKGYYRELLEQITRSGLQERVIFGRHRILSSRSTTGTGDKVYALADAYAHAVGCTYFSTYEGFGNAFVEAVLAKKPIFVNNYKPVFWPDIGSKGFEIVMLENNVLTDDAVAEIGRIVRDPGLQREMTEHNYALAKTLFSYEILEERLEELLTF